MKLKNFSSYILDRLPFRRKTPMDDEEGHVSRQDASDLAQNDRQRYGAKHITERNSYNNSSGQFKVPPLLPSMSESKISNKSGNKSNISAKSTKKILVSASSGYESSPNKSKTGSKSTNTSRSNSPSKSSQPSRTPQSEYAAMSSSSSSGLKKKHSPTSPSQQDYSGSSNTTANSESAPYESSPRYNNNQSQAQFSQQYNQYNNNYRGGHSVAPTSSPNVVIFGNHNNNNNNNQNTSTERSSTGRSTTAALLSQMGFPMGKSSAESKSGANHAPSSSGSSSQVIAVKPASTSATSSRSRDRSPSPARGSNSSSNNANASSSSAPGQPSPAAPAAATPGRAKLCCDKCDGKHETDDCPHYKKSRDAHPDAQKNKQIGGISSLPGNTLYAAKVVRQPGDGSCLFHSMSYGLPVRSNAARLRAEICSFIQSNPHLKISDTPLQDWVKWDANVSVKDYARRMSGGSWGGGIEMACFSLVSILSCTFAIVCHL